MPDGAVRNLVPFVHVADVRRSIAFYAQLGFVVGDTFEHHGHLGWAYLASGRGEIMVTTDGKPIDPKAQGVLFYLYSPDLAALREHLISQGIAAGPIRDGTPGPDQEMKVLDPDGYCLMIAQEGDD